MHLDYDGVKVGAVLTATLVDLADQDEPGIMCRCTVTVRAGERALVVTGPWPFLDTAPGCPPRGIPIGPQYGIGGRVTSWLNDQDGSSLRWIITK